MNTPREVLVEIPVNQSYPFRAAVGLSDVWRNTEKLTLLTTVGLKMNGILVRAFEGGNIETRRKAIQQAIIALSDHRSAVLIIDGDVDALPSAAYSQYNAATFARSAGSTGLSIIFLDSKPEDERDQLPQNCTVVSTSELMNDPTLAELKKMLTGKAETA